LKLRIPAIVREKTGSASRLLVVIPESYKDQYKQFIVANPGTFTIELSTNIKPRSTGYRSQNSHTHGHYEDIAFQLSKPNERMSAERVAHGLKMLAMKAGYWPQCRNEETGEPVLDPLTNDFQPLSEADSTTAECARLIEYIHWFADQHGFWLTEYINGEATKVYGGANPQND